MEPCGSRKRLDSVALIELKLNRSRPTASSLLSGDHSIEENLERRAGQLLAVRVVEAQQVVSEGVVAKRSSSRYSAVVNFRVANPLCRPADQRI